MRIIFMEQSPCETKDARLAKERPMFMKPESTLYCSQKSNNERDKSTLNQIKFFVKIYCHRAPPPLYAQISQIIPWIKFF